MATNGNGIAANGTLTETHLAAFEAAMFDYHTLASAGTDDEELYLRGLMHPFYFYYF
ncbi:hypothetical protein ACEF17_13185 [Streptococcus hyovaginalis]